MYNVWQSESFSNCLNNSVVNKNEHKNVSGACKFRRVGFSSIRYVTKSSLKRVVLPQKWPSCARVGVEIHTRCLFHCTYTRAQRKRSACIHLVRVLLFLSLSLCRLHRISRNREMYIGYISIPREFA